MSFTERKPMYSLTFLLSCIIQTVGVALIPNRLEIYIFFFREKLTVIKSILFLFNFDIESSIGSIFLHGVQ
jgi:hypothetical protein